jgi:hypothetical protein
MPNRRERDTKEASTGYIRLASTRVMTLINASYSFARVELDMTVLRVSNP